MGLYKALPVYRALPTVVLRPMPEISLACCCAVLFPKAGHVFPQQGLPDRWERRGGLLRSSPPTKWTRSIDFRVLALCMCRGDIPCGVVLCSR